MNPLDALDQVDIGVAESDGQPTPREKAEILAALRIKGEAIVVVDVAEDPGPLGGLIAISDTPDEPDRAATIGSMDDLTTAALDLIGVTVHGFAEIPVTVVINYAPKEAPRMTVIKMTPAEATDAVRRLADSHVDGPNGVVGLIEELEAAAETVADDGHPFRVVVIVEVPPA